MVGRAGGRKISSNAMGSVFGLAFVGIGVFLWIGKGKPVMSLVTIGIGGVVATSALLGLKKNLSNLSDPVQTVVKYEMRDPGTIIKRLLVLFLFYVVIFSVAAVTSSPSKAYRAVVEIATGPPAFLIVVLLVHVALILGMMFSSTSEHAP